MKNPENAFILSLYSLGLDQCNAVYSKMGQTVPASKREPTASDLISTFGCLVGDTLRSSVCSLYYDDETLPSAEQERMKEALFGDQIKKEFGHTATSVFGYLRGQMPYLSLLPSYMPSDQQVETQGVTREIKFGHLSLDVEPAFHPRIPPMFLVAHLRAQARALAATYVPKEPLTGLWMGAGLAGLMFVSIARDTFRSDDVPKDRQLAQKIFFQSIYLSAITQPMRLDDINKLNHQVWTARTPNQ